MSKKVNVDFKAHNVSEQVEAGIERIKPVMLERREDDVIKLKAEDLNTLLPEGVSVDDVKRVQNAVLDVSNALAGALGQIGVETKTEKLELAKVRLGHDTISGNFASEYKYRNVATGEDLVSHGRLTMNHTGLTGNRRRAGDFQQIANAVQEAADSIFAK
jgi:hypothetical protein